VAAKQIKIGKGEWRLSSWRTLFVQAGNSCRNRCPGGGAAWLARTRKMSHAKLRRDRLGFSASCERECNGSHHECSGDGYRQNRHIGRRERVFRHFGCEGFDHLTTQLKALREAGHVTRSCPAFRALTSIGWAVFPAALTHSSCCAGGAMSGKIRRSFDGAERPVWRLSARLHSEGVSSRSLAVVVRNFSLSDGQFARIWR
jgi:hypothetical protein